MSFDILLNNLYVSVLKVLLYKQILFVNIVDLTQFYQVQHKFKLVVPVDIQMVRLIEHFTTNIDQQILSVEIAVNQNLSEHIWRLLH